MDAGAAHELRKDVNALKQRVHALETIRRRHAVSAIHRVSSIMTKKENVKIYSCPFSYQMITEDRRPADGLTPSGRHAVLYNVMISIKLELEQLQFSIVTDGSSAWIYNAQIFRVTTALQSLLDAIARYCHDIYGSSIPEDGKIYFHRYVFHQADLQVVKVLQSQIGALSFMGMSFHDLANKLKHEIPWVGVQQTNSQGFVDIFDDNGNGLVYGLLENVFKASTTILKTIAPK